MKQDTLQSAEKFNKERQKKKRRNRILSIFGGVVALCTFYMLILPAITMEKEGSCKIPEHIHSEACYTQVTSVEKTELICAESHQHTEACYETVYEPVDTENLTCGLSEGSGHTHGPLCYGTWELTCGMEEHTHSLECQPVVDSGSDGSETAIDADSQESKVEELTGEDKERVEGVIKRIDELSSSDEIEGLLSTYESSLDEATYEDYYREIYLQVLTVYAYFEDLGPELQEYVTNQDKLMDLSWLWSAKDLAITDIITVYQINQYSKSVATLVYGGSVGEKLGRGMSYTYWDVLVVEKNSSGELYVSQYITADGDKRDYKATTADGFVLLVYDQSLNVNADDLVTVSFDYKTTGDYNSAGYGSVSFGSVSGIKPDKDNSGKLTIVQGADTKELIEVNLYDYDSRINELYRDNNKYPGFQQDNGSTSVGSTLSRFQSFNFGNNITEDLAAGIASVTNKGGAINATANGANSPISGAIQNTLGSDGKPALADGTSLGYLFSNSNYAKKKNTESINGLFRYNETTGAYTFNSRENHAQFNQGTNTFTLYDQIISSNFMMYPFGNFLPFNDIVNKSAQTSTIDREYLKTIAASAQFKSNQGAGAEYGTLAAQLNQFINLMDNEFGTSWTAVDAMNKYFALSGIPRVFDSNEQLLKDIYSIDYDEPTDFFFGMEMKMNFIQPKNGVTGPSNDQDMVFYFTGDDDVWVYIDGILFLDLSGIHRHVGGEIDFVRGEVKYYDLDVSTGDVSTTPSKTVKFSELVNAGLNSSGTFKDYSTHTFNFYYMERGAGSGVCRMNFNFPLLRQNTISVTKELSVDEEGKLDSLGNPDFRFQILKANSTDPFIAEGVAYDILDTAGNKIGSGTTGQSGVFTLKANQTAVFSGIKEDSGKYYVRELLEPDAFRQYGNITVDGSTVTTETDSDVVIGSDTFKGVDSPIKDMSDGSTAFHFDNELIFNKLGRLEITKKLENVTKTRETLEYRFLVTLDNSPLPVGTKYMVGTVEKTVTEAGIVSLAPDEIAVISNIIAGSRFTVQETGESASGYTVTYTGQDLKQETNETGAYVSGVIKTNTSVAITAINTERGAVVAIPGVKILENPDKKAHSFSFRLEQVSDASGNNVVEGGVTQTVTVDFAGDDEAGSADFQFLLSYLEKDMKELPTVFYYKITEAAGESNYVKYDPSVYVAKVTVVPESDELKATLTDLWKNGEAITDTEVSFTNVLIGDLTIGKRVVGDAPTDTEFSFEVILKQGDSPLGGSFNGVRANGSGESSEEVVIEFDSEGKSNISLKDGETLKLTGIPVGTAFSVAELDAAGYRVSYQIGSAAEEDGKKGTGTIEGTGSSITFFNAVGYELPDTGGAGTVPYTAGGMLISGIAILMLLIERKRRRGDYKAS